MDYKALKRVKSDKIINLVGASGSGKTAVARELDKLGYNIVQSYTSRSPRYKDEWGHEFIDKFLKLDPPKVIFKHKGVGRVEEFIAYFNNYEKHEHYFATKEQIKGKGTSIYIVDPIGAGQVKDIVRDIEVITIHLDADESTRKDRLTLDRSREEVAARLKKDRNIFNEVPCDFKVDANKALFEVVESVLRIIQELEQKEVF